MEGNQHRDCGPANRHDVQVLEIFCYHRASQVYTSVQGPQRGLNMNAKSSLISQICLYSNIDPPSPPQWILYQFCDAFWHRGNFPPPQLMETVILTAVGGYLSFSVKKKKKKNL